MNKPLSQETQSEGSHTPGPWVSFYKDKYKEWHVGVPVSSGSMKLALFPDGCPTDNPGPDCRLIAAAPDLLAALTRLIGTPKCWDDLHHQIGCKCVIHEARSAVCKATGVES